MHYTIAKMVDALRRRRHQGLLRAVGDFSDAAPARAQFRNAFSSGLRRRLVAAPLADHDRQKSVLARPRRGGLRPSVLEALRMAPAP